MRMWMVDPEIMCQKHLCGEHVEMHMFLGTFQRQKKVDGYLRNNCLEPRALYQRHLDLAKEMKRRGYNHKSPISEEDCFSISYLTEYKQNWEINRTAALTDLIDRCPECNKRFSSWLDKI